MSEKYQKDWCYQNEKLLTHLHKRGRMDSTFIRNLKNIAD